MTTKNDITGDTIQTKIVSDLYRENYDRIFRKQQNTCIETASIDIIETSKEGPDA